jgi:hypothetical protein
VVMAMFRRKKAALAQAGAMASPSPLARSVSSLAFDGQTHQFVSTHFSKPTWYTNNSTSYLPSALRYARFTLSFLACRLCPVYLSA